MLCVKDQVLQVIGGVDTPCIYLHAADSHHSLFMFLLMWPMLHVSHPSSSFNSLCHFQVMVQFRAINGEAQDKQDFSLLSRQVVLSSGETSKLVPIVINDDLIPELSETFTIELLDQITGGASLGENRTAVITIEPSDDPNGVFGEWA